MWDSLILLLESLRIWSTSKSLMADLVRVFRDKIKKLRQEEWRTLPRLINSMLRSLRVLVMIHRECRSSKKVSRLELSLQ